MPFKLKKIWPLLKTTFKSWNEKDPFRQSAIISYYSIFSIPALLVIIIAVAGLFFGREVVSGYIHDMIADTMGNETAKSIQEMIIKTSEEKKSVWAAIIGIATLLIGATTVFAQFQKSLNIIWEVKADPDKEGIMDMLKTRLFSFGLIVSIGFLLLISLVITSMLTAVSDYLKSNWPDALLYIFYVIEFLISFAVITVLFALMFKILPDAKIKWRYVWIGAMLTGLLFVIGKFALGFYFGKADPGSAYGAAGSIILIMLWVSYSSMIVFFGAEFTKAYSDMYGHGTIPDKHAVKVEGRGKEGDC